MSKEGTRCSVCGSGRQRHLIYIYVIGNKFFGSYKKHTYIKYIDVRCTRCLIYEYEIYYKRYIQRHMDMLEKECLKKSWESFTDYSKFYRFLPDQKLKVNEFRNKNAAKEFFSLYAYNVFKK